MANQRMYLSCTCGKQVILGKRLSGAFEVCSVVLEDDVDDFFYEHKDCGVDQFTLEYEHKRGIL